MSTSKAGVYEAKLKVPKGTLPAAKVEVEAAKPSFQTSARMLLDKVLPERVDEKGNAVFLAHQSLKMKRAISPAFWIATLVLLLVYALIAFEVMHRTLAALLGAALLMFITYTVGTFNSDYTILKFEDAMQAMDMNVIFLLMAMMIIVGVMKKTGVFQWLAYKSFQVARGNVFALAAVLMFVTAFTSAFLDNVTTMLLIIPVTIEIAVTLKTQPGPPAAARGLRLQRGRHGHPDRRPAQHHDRLLRQAEFCGLCPEPDHHLSDLPGRERSSTFSTGIKRAT